MSAFATELGRRTAPLAADDADNGYAWATLCVAMAAMFDPFEVARDTNQGPGFSSLLDLQRAPYDALGWLGMFVGVTTLQGLDDAAQRARIDESEGFARGTPRAIVAAAQRRLTGNKRVALIERDGGDAYYVRVITYTAETPQPALTAADIRAAMPVGLIVNVETRTGQTWADLVAEQPMWSSTQAAYPTWQRVIDKIPI